MWAAGQDSRGRDVWAGLGLPTCPIRVTKLEGTQISSREPGRHCALHCVEEGVTTWFSHSRSTSGKQTRPVFFLPFSRCYLRMEERIAGEIVPFSEATKIERLDSHTYRANLVDSFCIGTGRSIQAFSRGVLSNLGADRDRVTLLKYLMGATWRPVSSGRRAFTLPRRDRRTC